MFRRKYRNVDLKKKARDSSPSIFSRIDRQVRGESLANGLDYSQFPSITAGDSKLQFAAGALDAVFREHSENTNDWKTVSLVIDAINRNKITEWTVVEQNVQGISAIDNIDHVLANVALNDISSKVRRLFVEMALESGNHEAVKWGIGVGGVRVSPDVMTRFLTLAHHSEFTLYVAHVIHRESNFYPEYKKHFVRLLPVCFQWGVIRLIEYIVIDEELIKDKGVQRAILVHGMENNEGIPMEVGYTIAKAIDIDYFFNEAQGDVSVRNALTELMNTLLLSREPLGGLLDMDDGRVILGSYIDFLRTTPPDVRSLSGLKDIELFLDDEDTGWDDRDLLLDDVKRIYDEIFQVKLLHDGLKDDKTRWLSLKMIRQNHVAECIPEVRKIFIQQPTDLSTIMTIGEIGDAGDVELMFERIQDIVDLESRREIPFSHVNVFGKGHERGHEYANIVQYLWKCPTAPILDHLKNALNDYNPEVRRAACIAVSKLPLQRIDSDFAARIESRLEDRPDYVREAAEEAARALRLSSQEKRE